MTPTDAQWAWIAGLFEGEGHIAFLARSVQVRIRMTDHDVLQRLDALQPSFSGLRPLKKYKDHYKQQWSWDLCNAANVTAFLQGVLPWLGERRGTRAIEGLARIAALNAHNKDKTHCKFGHPLSGENLYMSPSNGQRACRTCKVRHCADYEARQRR